MVERIIGEGPDTIQFLNQWGMEFDQTRNFTLAQEGGHSQRRIYTHGDRTGAGIIRVLIQAVRRLPQSQILEHQRRLVY